MNINKSIYGVFVAGLLAVGTPTGVSAQEAGEAAALEEDELVLEEIIVTGRKREELLRDVPVAITTFSQDYLVESGITNLQKLYEATPGLTFDTAHGDRNSSQPAIRGIQSNRVLSTLQKVSSFVDGIPMSGQVASLTFAGIDQVEVYRGPQSAAFGRATFAGAINYTTSDATEEFEGQIQARTSNLDDNELGISISGPLGDKLGYRLTFIADEFTGPDEWTANNGAKMGTEETKTFIAKLNFEFSEKVYGEVIYMWVEQDDTYGPFNRLDPADCNYDGDSGIFLRTGGRFLELPSGAWDCDVHGTPLRRNHDALGQFTAAYDDHIDEYTAAAPDADTNGDGIVSLEEYLAQTTPAFGTFEQALQGQTMQPRVVNERQRIQGTLNFEIGDNGHLLQILGMTNEEDFNRWFDADRSDAHPVFFMNNIYMAGLLTMLAGTTSQPSTEDYAEVRWVSPSDHRFRYMLSAAYYAYDYRIEVFSNWGAREYGLTHPDGTEISALRNIVIGQGMTNVGAAFGLQYDWTDRTTLSFEGRWQNDENCGEDAVVEGKLCQEADSFAPRLAFNTAITDNHNVYGQISQGTNPGGVNLAYIDPNIEYSLAVARGDIPVPDVPGAVNAGVTYNGQDGNPPPAVDYMPSDWTSYEEEELTNFEIGAKGRFGSGRGSYELALFYMDWDNVLDRRILDWNDDTEGGWNEGYWNDYIEAHTYLNEGDAIIKGLEFSSRFNISDIWSIEGNLTLLDATYDNYCAPQATEYFTSDTPPLTNVLPILTREEDGVLVACGVVDGNKLPRIADFSGFLRVAADLPNEIFGFTPRFNADVLYEGSHYDDPLNLIKRNSVTTLNLAAMFVHPKLTLRFFVNNVTDEEEPRSLGWGTFLTDNANPTVRPAMAASWEVLPRRPREYGITAIYRFGNN
jgi:outer membrane receptor protein involved in Fe transport